MACGSTSPSEEDLARIDAIIVTDLGEVAIELYDHTPIHRDNFLKLAKEDFFDSLAFHRVIYEFMIQVGDPRTRLSYPAVDTSLDDGPGYDLPGEMGPQSIHTPGKIGAARQPDDKNPEKRSAGSQFYIVSEGEAQPRELIDSMEVVYTGMVRGRIYQAYQKAIAEGRYEGDFDSYQTALNFEEWYYPAEVRKTYLESGGAPWLDFNYTVFGEVIEGMDVVNQINQTAIDDYNRPQKAIRILDVKVMDTSIKP